MATGDGRCAHALAATIIGWLWIPSLAVYPSLGLLIGGCRVGALTRSRFRRLDRVPDARGRGRHVEMPHAERRQRVHHRVHDGGGGGDGAGLTASLDAQPVGAAWKVAGQAALEDGK